LDIFGIIFLAISGGMIFLIIQLIFFTKKSDKKVFKNNNRP
jgi:hypothetical protein